MIFSGFGRDAGGEKWGRLQWRIALARGAVVLTFCGVLAVRIQLYSYLVEAPIEAETLDYYQ